MKKIWTFAIACVLLTVPAYALVLDDPGVVGTIEAGTQNSSIANEVQWANFLLDMGADEFQTTDGNNPPDGKTENYQTSLTDYNGFLTGGTQVQNSTDVSGYEWVLAKYDGPLAGYVLFNVPGLGGTTIPQLSHSIWGGPGQYDLSHFTGFGSTSVPDGGATLMLLGGALVGLETLRRRFRV